jgi:hypothetical protein
LHFHHKIEPLAEVISHQSFRNGADRDVSKQFSRTTAQISAKLIRLYLGHSTTLGAAKSASSTTCLTLADYNSNDGLFASALT